MQKFPEYDASAIHPSPFPHPEDCGDGWWRKTWEVEADPPDLPGEIHVPSLARDIEDRPLVVAVLPQEAGRIIVEVFTTSAPIMDEEVVYTAFVLQALRASSHHFTINGDSDHTILHMVKAPD